MRGRLSDEGAEIETPTPAQLAAFVRKEIDKWAQAVTISGAKLRLLGDDDFLCRLNATGRKRADSEARPALTHNVIHKKCA